MTDDTPPPTVPAAIVCDREDCHALVPDTIEDRRAHRLGHKHRDKVDEAIREAIKELRVDFGTLRGETRDRVKEIHDEVAGIDRAVGKIEIPEPVQPLTINRGSWDDDDEDEPVAEHDPWADLTSTSDPDETTPTPAAAGPAPLDEDDLDDEPELPTPTRRF